MSYTHKRDFSRHIQADNLAQILNSDYSLLSMAQLTAEEEVASYLTTKYDLDYDLLDIETYSLSEDFYAATPIILDGDDYSALTNYNTNDIMIYSGKCYYTLSASTGINPTSSASTWVLLGNQYDLYHTIVPEARYDYTEYYTAGIKVFWRNKIWTATAANCGIYPDSVNTYWSGSTYIVPAGTLLTDALYYSVGDSRSQKLISVMVDISLYHLLSRISPRNIPDLRIIRYEESIKWLKMIIGGDLSQINLIKRTPRQGHRIRITSQTKNTNNY